MQALTGVDQIGAGGGSGSSGQLSGAGVGLTGQVGKVQVGLQGRFSQLSSSGSLQGLSAPAAMGQASSLALDVSRGQGSRVSILSLNNRMDGGTAGLRESGDGPGPAPVDFEHYQVSWSQEVGENGRSEFSAHYTDENNFHRQGADRPAGHPGGFADLAGRGRLHGRLRRPQLAPVGPAVPRAPVRPQRSRPAGQGYEPQALSSIDLFSRGGVRVQPAVLLEYGLYSTLSDGSLALTPQGGIVLQLGSNWQLETSAARRVYTNAAYGPDFLPTLFAQRDLCEQGSDVLLPGQPVAHGRGGQLADLRRRPPHDRRHPAALLQRRLLRPAGEPLPGARRRAAGGAVRLPPQDLAPGGDHARLQRGRRRRRHLLRGQRPAVREPGALHGDLARHPVPGARRASSWPSTTWSSSSTR